MPANRLCRPSCRPAFLGKAAVIGLLALAWAGPARGADAPSSEVRTFTNTSGKTIQAQVVNVDNDTVYLKRADGKSFQIPIATFGSEDQDYIRDWAIQEALHNASQLFEISAAPNRGASTTANGLMRWGEGYKVKLANQTTLHVLNPTIEYVLFNLKLNASVLKTTGSATLKELPANAETTFDTKNVGVIQYGVGTGDYETANKPIGIWVRVYDSNQDLLQEWSEPSDLMKTETWGGGAPAPRPTRKSSPTPPSSGDGGGSGSDKTDASGGSGN